MEGLGRSRGVGGSRVLSCALQREGLVGSCTHIPVGTHMCSSAPASLASTLRCTFPPLILQTPSSPVLRRPPGVHALERWRALAAEKRGDDGSGPWEWQGSFLYHLELGQDLALHSLTLAHYLHLWVVHGGWWD